MSLHTHRWCLRNLFPSKVGYLEILQEFQYSVSRHFQQKSTWLPRIHTKNLKTQLIASVCIGRVCIRVCVHSKIVKISFMGVQCRPAVLLLPAWSTQVLCPPLVISVKPDK